MKLTELDARFLRREVRGEGVYHVTVEQLSEADGVMFLCPLCFAANGGRIGTHQVICWFAGRVPDDAAPGPGRWNPQGTGLDDLTFVPPGATSVLLTGGGCAWHGFVIGGDAT